jgi:hypothetical protein
MNYRPKFHIALALAIGFGIATSLTSLALAQKPTPPTGKITPWAAIASATKKVPGRAISANFEFDEGHWIYGVMVISGGKISEVEVDPTTGKVGDVESIDPVAEGKEVTQELQAALKAG